MVGSVGCRVCLCQVKFGGDVLSMSIGCAGGGGGWRGRGGLEIVRALGNQGLWDDHVSWCASLETLKRCHICWAV